MVRKEERKKERKKERRRRRRRRRKESTACVDTILDTSDLVAPSSSMEAVSSLLPSHEALLTFTVCFGLRSSIGKKCISFWQM